MAYTYTIVGHFLTHAEAEKVVSELEQKGFHIQRRSLVGKDYQTTEYICRFLSKDPANSGATGGDCGDSFVEGLLSNLAGTGELFIRGMTAIIAASIAGVVVGWVEGAVAGVAAVWMEEALVDVAALLVVLL